MRPLPASFRAYEWTESTEDIARRFGLDPFEVLRFDANVPFLPLRSSRPSALASTVATINEYPHDGYRTLTRAIASYADVGPENVVLGAGADDLIFLSARTFAGPGDVVAIADEPTYPVYRIAAAVAGAEVGDARPAVTFCCRPHNPTGALRPLPSGRPLVVDEAYFEYCRDTAADVGADDIVVLRTFSKAFALAGARVGYALASEQVARELRKRQTPAPVSTLSASLALAALASGCDVDPEIEERERLAGELRALGLEPLESATNFLFLPLDDATDLHQRLLSVGIVVRPLVDGVRVTARDAADDDVLVQRLADLLDRGSKPHEASHRQARHVRATSETVARARLRLDGEARVDIVSGAAFYDHLFEQLAFHAGFDLMLQVAGDVETGDHHTVEDAALVLGEALDRALGSRAGIARFGDSVVAMDDAVARVVVDLGGRPWSKIALDHDPGLAGHALASFAQAARITLHVESSGHDPHHVVEAAFKALGRALSTATARSGNGIPSTKGRL